MIANPSPKARVLKVQDVGDRYLKQVKLQIRLQGKWLVNAGLRADQYVKVTNPKAGVLVIQCLEQ